MVMLTSPSDFGGVVLWQLAIMMVEHSLIGSAFWSGSSARDCPMSISRWTDSPPVRLTPLARDSDREVMMCSSCPFNSI